MDKATLTEEEVTVKANQIIKLLDPCLKQVRHNGSLYYDTAWGYKTEEGLTACIKVILRSDEQVVQ